jgi:hypothetical protein
MNQYLIPANTKKGALILSLFTPTDLIIFGSGIGLSIILIFFVSLGSLTSTILVLTPGLFCAFLVLPVPNYHNIRTLIKEIFLFFTERRIFIWKGWCVYELDKPEKK